MRFEDDFFDRELSLDDSGLIKGDFTGSPESNLPGNHPADFSLRRIEPELRRKAEFGAFLWWSEQVPCWVHPDDTEIAARLVPGNRVFKRQECDNFADRKLGFALLSYGSDWFRAQPAIWLPLQRTGFEIGDLVEVKSRLGRRRPMIRTIQEMRWNRQSRQIEYWVGSKAHTGINNPFLADDLQPAVRLEGFLNERESSLMAQSRLASRI